MQNELSEKYGIGRTFLQQCDILREKNTHHYSENYAGNKKMFTFSSKYVKLNDLLIKLARSKTFHLAVQFYTKRPCNSQRI
jgi:hypothetical protein